MTTRYLLDTNTVSYAIRGNPGAVRRRLRSVPLTQLAVSAVTEGELRYGVARRVDASRLRGLVDDFLLMVTVEPWDSEAAQQYGLTRAALEREVHPIGNVDIMIGSHALALGAILVTNDQAFKYIRGLKTENWAE